MKSLAVLLGGTRRNGAFVLDALTDYGGRRALTVWKDTEKSALRLVKRPCFCEVTFDGECVSALEPKDDFSRIDASRKPYADAALSVCKRLPEGVPLLLFLRAFGAFAYETADPRAVLIRYLAEALDNLGMRQDFSKCAECGHAFGTYSDFFFAPLSANIVCTRCADADAYALQGGTAKLLKSVLETEFTELKSVPMPEDTAAYLLFLFTESFRNLIGDVPALEKVRQRK